MMVVTCPLRVCIVRPQIQDTLDVKVEEMKKGKIIILSHKESPAM